MESIGKITFLSRGDYDASAVYNYLDWVRYNGASWACKVNGTTGITPASGANWGLLAQDGSGGGASSGGEKMIRSTVGWTGKNLMNIPASVVTQTISGETFTVNRNSEGAVTSIAISGSPTGVDSTLVLYTATASTLPAGNYVLSSGFVDNTHKTYLILRAYNGSTFVRILGDTYDIDNCPITLDYSGYDTVKAEIIVNSGIARGYTYYPMLRDESSLSGFEPYHLPVTDYAHEAVAEGIGWGNKNLLPYPYLETTKTTNGITFTDNGDGTIKVNGTATADAFFALHYDSTINEICKKGDIILSGGNSTARIILEKTDGNYIIDNGSGASIPMGTTFHYDTVIKVSNGGSVSNAILKPMLRYADIADSTYEPYHPAVKQTLRDAELISGKNLLPNTAKSTSGYGITWTVDENGVVNANGTSTSNDAQLLYAGWTTNGFRLSDLGMKPNSQYKLVRGNTNSDTLFYVICCNASGGNQQVFQISDGNTALFTVPNDAVFITPAIRIKSGKTVNNLKFYPMITIPLETDDYEPYYRTIHQQLRDAEVIEGKNLLDVFEVYDSNRNVAFTVNENRNGAITSIVANGAPTSGANAFIRLRAFLKRGSYIFSGLPNGSDDNYFVDITKDDSTYITRVYTSKVFTVDADQIIRFFFNIKDGYTANNVKLLPMVTYATEEDQGFEPYYISPKDATKNINRSTYRNYVNNGITFSLLNGGRVQANGTASGGDAYDNADPALGFVADFTGQCYFSGGVNANAYVYVYDYNISNRAYADATKTSYSGDANGYGVYKPVYIEKGHRYNLIIRVVNTKTVSNVILQPMLCLESNSSDKYIPYIMTNEELTNELLKPTESSCTDIVGTASVNKLYKIGKLVTLDLNLSGVTANAWSTFAKIPSGFRPKHNFRAHIYDTLNNAVYVCSIPAGGAIQCVSELSNRDFVMHATWITD